MFINSGVDTLLVGVAGGCIVALANIIQTRIAGRQAVALAAQSAKDAAERQRNDWDREDMVAARLERADQVSADQFLQLLRQGAETKALVNHRLTIALQAQLLALRGTLAVMSEKSDPSHAVRDRIIALTNEIAALEKELSLRDIQQAELDRHHADEKSARRAP